MLSIKNKLYNETIIVTDLKIQDNARPEFYLTIDSDSDSSVYTADHTLTIDTKNTSPTLEIAANLTIESTSLINQDLTTDAAATFNTLNLAATSNQIVLQSGGVTGTITATPASSNKTWTLQDVTGTIYQTGGTDVAVADGGTGGGTAAIGLFNNITGYTASGATGTTSTNLVFSTSPTFITPTLGTPDGGTLTSCTGLPLTTGITGTLAVGNGGTGRATSTTAYGLLVAGTTVTGAHQTLSAGATTEILVGAGASAVPAWTTATGSGSPVRATSPILVTPALGAATATSISISEKIIETVAAHNNVGSGTENFDLNDGSYHTVTATGDFIVTFSNWPSSGMVSSITIKLTDAGAYTITWPDGVDWPGGVEPAWTSSGTDFVLFFTDDGGTIIHGIRSIQDSK